jgi:hypothetical protein
LSLSTIRRLPPWSLALAAVLLAVCWQWATVNANFRGNWTALYCTGGLQSTPPLATAEHVYLFPGSGGFDGQFYHYMAHDPAMRGDLARYVDDPRLRYRRIFVPALAYALALGDSRWVDAAYELVCLLSIGLGVYWSCSVARSAGLATLWGVVFLLAPAVPITLDRLVADATLAALTAAFIYYGRAPSWKLFAVLACATATRETGWLLIAAYSGHLVLRREFGRALIYSCAVLPAACWYLYVQLHTVGMPYELSIIPLSAIVGAVTHPLSYPTGVPFVLAVHAADYVALGGVLLAFAWALRYCERDGVTIAAALFAVMALLLQRPDHWLNVYDYGRVYSPLLVCLAAVGARRRTPWLLAPMAMMLPRIAIQWTPQILGILRGRSPFA